MELLLKTIPALTRVLSISLLDKIRLWFELYYFAFSRKTIFRNIPHKFALHFNGTAFMLSLHSNVDLASLREVFVDKEYDWQLEKTPQVIVDLGAHYGDTSVYYHLRYPEAKIYALEPEPISYQRLEENVRDIPEIVPMQLAISDKDGEMELHISESSLGHSLFTQSRSSSAVKVPTKSFKTFLQQIDKPDLVKFDIEGAEQFLFINLRPAEVAGAFIGELHEDLSDVRVGPFKSLFDDFVVETQALPQSGRYLFKAVHQRGVVDDYKSNRN